MFKSIFAKQFAAYTGTLVLGFVFVGIVLSNLFTGYFIKQKTETLVEQGSRIVKSLTKYDFFRTQAAAFQFQNDVKMLSSLGASCFFINGDAEVMSFTSDIPNIEYKQVLEDESVKAVLAGEIVSGEGNMNGIFNENVLTVGYPIKVNGGVWGAIFMSSSLSDVESTVNDIIRITSLCLLLSLAISFILIYITSKNITRPIYKINEAAKEIASGDFEKRLDVESQDEVGQLASSFNNMAESLENIEKSRREFIANISHDLRSPLTSMRGFLQAIMDGTIPEEKRSKYLAIVLEESERLSKLANDILDISKIQNMNIELDRKDFDVNELIRKTALMFETRITSKNILMDISFTDEKNIVNADMEKIQRVIYNLLDNAIKFTESEIKISTKVEDGKVYVSISDNGKGLDAESQKKVFERFYKADESRGEDKKGSGLGLSIVWEFIKAHGENVSVNSSVGEGCEFVFCLTSVA